MITSLGPIHAMAHVVVRRLATLLGLAAVVPAVAGAQRSGDGFLFGAPKATVTLRGGAALPGAGSDVFRFAARQLTLEREDFRGASLGAEVGIPVSPRLSIQLSAARMQRTVQSEFRDWVDADDRPIEQETAFRRTPVTVGVRYHLRSPGRSLSRLVWIPTRVVPYVAAGAGAMWYGFEQSGDFVDFETLDVFRTTLRARGRATTGYAAGGVSWALSPRMGLGLEARYDAARGAMGGDFQGFNRLDLSGFATGVGLDIRF